MHVITVAHGGQNLTLNAASPATFTFLLDARDPYEPRITVKLKE